MREAPSITIIKELIKRGATIKVYDPKAEEQAKDYYLADMKNIIYCDDKYNCVRDTDGMILVTEWDEFKEADLEYVGTLMKHKIIFDGRNIYTKERLLQNKYEYYQIGVGE